MQDWQRRRANEKRKLRQMDLAFGGSMARLRAMYLRDDPDLGEESGKEPDPRNGGRTSAGPETTQK